MTYEEKKPIVPQSSQEQQLYGQKRLYSNRDNLWYPPSHLSPSQSLRIVCKAEERHFITNTLPNCNIDSSLKPICITMNDQFQPIQFRSEIILHNNPETDLRIQRLRVAFNYKDDSPATALIDHHPKSWQQSSPRTNSSDRRESSLPQRQQQSTNNDSRRRSSTSKNLLHQWIDDICANEDLMSNDDIVFFIKNGEFFARI